MNSKKKGLRSIKIDRGIVSRILLILLVIGMVIFTIWISGPVPPKDDTRIITKPYHTAMGQSQETLIASNKTGDQTVMDTMAIAEPYVTPEVTSDQVTTTGVVFGTIAIVLIIIVGTLFTLWQSKDGKTKQRK